MPALLEIKNLEVAFVTDDGPVTAVKNISFEINRNEILGIAGESGSGKSVTSLAILQLLPAKGVRYLTGQILFSADGQSQVDLLKLSEGELRSIRGKHISMIFQEPMTSLNPLYTCGDQVMEAILQHNKISRQLAKAKTLALFEKVKLPEPAIVFERYPHQLSGGQKQRVMIAMALSSEPSLLICDEPTTALDVTVQQTVLELIKDLQSETGMGVIFITHDLAVLAQVAERLLVMYKGSIIESGKCREILQAPSHAYTKQLLLSRPATYEKTKGAQQPLISVENLVVDYPSKKPLFGSGKAPTRAVNSVSFTIYSGETLGLVGESGCGKTSLGRAILRLIQPSSGRILYRGNDISEMSPKTLRSLRRRIQIVFQDPYSSLNPSMTVGEAIGEPLKIHEPALSSRQRRARVIHLLERTGLDSSHYHRYPHEFSGGQRQRIVISRALILNPDFVVCDESVSALDVSIQTQVLNLINELKKELGFACLFISHDLGVVQSISDRIMVMHKGRIEEIGPAGKLFNHPTSAYTKRLLEAIPTLPSQK